MIRIYTAPSCASCRKVKAWLKEHQIPYVEKNIFSTLLRETELKELLERSENGTDDIISKRSKIIKENKIDIDEMSINELIHFIQKNPSILKRPIIIDERRFKWVIMLKKFVLLFLVSCVVYRNAVIVISVLNLRILKNSIIKIINVKMVVNSLKSVSI